MLAVSLISNITIQMCPCLCTKVSALPVRTIPLRRCTGSSTSAGQFQTQAPRHRHAANICLIKSTSSNVYTSYKKYIVQYKTFIIYYCKMNNRYSRRNCAKKISICQSALVAASKQERAFHRSSRSCATLETC